MKIDTVAWSRLTEEGKLGCLFAAHNQQQREIEDIAKGVSDLGQQFVELIEQIQGQNLLDDSTDGT